MGASSRLRAVAAAVRTRVQNILFGFLFLPGAIAVAFVALSFLLTWLDRLGGRHGVGGFDGDAATARSILSTIATALITVSGLTFSITVVSLQLVSQQFSPRALRNFLGDRITQVVAGTFVGIFAYCLLVLRTVREGKTTPEFVPGLSVSFAIGLGVITLGLLLVFIHHMSSSIQLSTIASGITRATLQSLDRLYPEAFGEPAEEEDGAELLRRWRHHEPNVRVRAPRPGYVQAIALDEIPGKLGVSDARGYVSVAPGDFVTSRSILGEFWVGGRELEAEELEAIFVVANERDVGQDVLYGLRQLADIAIRALSPGVSDPTTARTCVGYMQAVLEVLTERSLPDPVRRCRKADLVLVARTHEYEDYLDPLAEVRRHAAGDDRVESVIEAAVASIAEHAESAGATERARLLRQRLLCCASCVPPSPTRHGLHARPHTNHGVSRR
jgi:uncharacterized membrane protein